MPRCAGGADEHGVGLVAVTARRGDRSLNVNDVNVFHLRDGKVTECWIASTDQQAEDEFGREPTGDRALSDGGAATAGVVVARPLSRMSLVAAATCLCRRPAAAVRSTHAAGASCTETLRYVPVGTCAACRART